MGIVSMSNIKSIDVTDLVDFSNPDDECLSLIRCVCGQEFPAWTFVISIYSDTPRECDSCGRKFYFSSSVRIFEVLGE